MSTNRRKRCVLLSLDRRRARTIPRLEALPQTSSPLWGFPFTTAPAKSRLGVRDRVVFLKPPATSPMSLGLIAAADAELVYCAAQKSEIAALIGLEDFVQI
jgi:hypothetical protein